MAALSSFASLLGGTLLGGVFQQSQAARAQKDAMQASADAAKKTAQMQDEAINRANQKKPDVAALSAANASASLAGNAGTMLTGPMGAKVDPATLGRATLLGG